MNKKLNFEITLQYICDVLDISVDDIKSKCRAQKLVRARIIFAYLREKYSDISRKTTAKELNRNVSSLAHYVSLHNSKLIFDIEYNNDFEKIFQYLNNKLLTQIYGYTLSIKRNIDELNNYIKIKNDNKDDEFYVDTERKNIRRLRGDIRHEINLLSKLAEKF